MHKERAGYLFVAPCVMVILLVLGFPMLYVLVISLTKYRPMISMEWIGLKNYANILKDEMFWIACGNTFVFTLSSVIFHVLLGMGAALLLNRSFRGRRLVRTLTLLPWMLSYMVGAITWRWLLNGSYGILNEVLLQLGLIQEYTAWLGHKDTAMFFVILANIWKQFPYVMLMFIAGLQSIPHEQYEAAWIDGAGAFKCFRAVTLPNLRGVVVITSTLDFIWSFKQFDLIQTMTGGGPGVSTDVLSTLVYRTFFSDYNFGKASAYAVVLLLIVLVISVFYGRLVFPSAQSDD